MKSIDIAFGRPAGGRWRAGRLAVAAFVVAAAGASYTAYQWGELDRQITQMQASVAALDRSGGAHPGDAPAGGDEAKIAPEQITAVNHAVARLNLPWQDLLDQLERAEMPNVSLVAIEPDPQRGVVRLTAEASGPDAMVDYVAGLARQPDFVAVAIRKHHVDQQDPTQPVRFTVELTWRPGKVGVSR
jgi:hypothetical protein